jgi:dTDP-4-dehydrorhamnose 3,5-epimerase
MPSSKNAPIKDTQTVTPEGTPLAALPHGVKLRDTVTHIDERGSLFEGYDPRWGWHPAPLVYAYFVTIRPGVVKGWAYHEHHEDRYFIVSGELEVILYDDRPDSPTRGLLSRVVLSHYRRQLLLIPTHIWHADHNIGQSEVILANFPTQPYDHANPDKFRLPLNNDVIPHHFDNPKGW